MADDKPPTNQTAQTEYTTGKPGQSSPNHEEPADDGAAVDQAEIAEAAQPPPEPAKQ